MFSRLSGRTFDMVRELAYEKIEQAFGDLDSYGEYQKAVKEKEACFQEVSIKASPGLAHKYDAAINKVSSDEYTIVYLQGLLDGASMGSMEKGELNTLIERLKASMLGEVEEDTQPAKIESVL